MRQRLKRLLADVPEVQVIGEAVSAQEAMAAALAQAPDVILLDIHLLNGSGIDVLQYVKRLESPPAVIILTDYPYPQYQKKCIEAGADFFFVKSTEFDKIVPALLQLSRGASVLPPTDG
jgi:DNA-binding NarL/FixJ family response regulator